MVKKRLVGTLPVFLWQLQFSLIAYTRWRRSQVELDVSRTVDAFEKSEIRRNALIGRCYKMKDVVTNRFIEFGYYVLRNTPSAK